MALDGVQKGPIYIDYVVAVPQESSSDRVMRPLQLELPDEFVEKCSHNIFRNHPRSVTDYCRQTIFSLTTELNGAAQACDCNTQGSLDFACADHDGQCKCKPNVSGRKCDRCADGYFNFPDFIKRECGLNHQCDEKNGQCSCPRYVDGIACDCCVQYAHGYDALIGCQQCGCFINGSMGAEQRCDSLNGQCLCKENVGGRKCEHCLVRDYTFPECRGQSGTTDDVCNDRSSKCAIMPPCKSLCQIFVFFLLLGPVDGAIFGGTVGSNALGLFVGLVFGGGLAAGLMWIRNRRRRPPQQPPAIDNANNNNNANNNGGGGGGGGGAGGGGGGAGGANNNAAQNLAARHQQRAERNAALQAARLAYEALEAQVPDPLPDDDELVEQSPLKTAGDQERQYERRLIAQAYKNRYQEDLIEIIQNELPDDGAKELILALLYEMDVYDAISLHSSMKGLGTDEHVLTEILVTRSNDQIRAIRKAYTKLYNTQLEADIGEDTSGTYKRLLSNLCAVNRDESGTVKGDKAKQDAQTLFGSGEKRLGTNENAFLTLLTQNNQLQLNALFHEYERLAGRPMEKELASEFSGDILDALNAIVHHALNPARYFADRLNDSIKNQNERDLIRLVVTRAQSGDLPAIGEELKKIYGLSLKSLIDSESTATTKQTLAKACGGGNAL